MTSAASVKDRLKNHAAENGQPMQEVLTAYGLERTIYRLSASEYAERFTLKGGFFSTRFSTESMPGLRGILIFWRGISRMKSRKCEGYLKKSFQLHVMMPSLLT